MSKIQAIRGMNDILPEQSLTWHYFERKFHQVVKEFGYQEIRFPVLEQTQLFKRSIGEVTDIVEKEMYSFDDRNGDNLSLRPEGTAGCVRAANQHGLLYNQQQRLWYQGAMFRHERPQKGRYRQFHQFGVEAFGMVGPDIDAEIIQLSHKLWAELDLHDYLQLEINNIGSADDRKAYSAALTEFLSARAELLDDDARRRMHSNPLRVLDSKNPDVQSALQGAPVLADYVSDESKQHFASLCEYLDDLGVAYNLNPRLVRGLDYYNYCVFEWTTEQLGAQGAVCGGGRYDGLVAQLGGRATPAAGFAIGIERIVLMLDGLEKVPAADLKPIDIYVLAVGQGVQGPALRLAASLRERYPGFGVISHCGGGKYNSQLKRAFACGARIAVVLEQDSETTDSAPGAKLRRLDDSGESVTVELSEVAERLDEFLGNSDS